MLSPQLIGELHRNSFPYSGDTREISLEKLIAALGGKNHKRGFALSNEVGNGWTAAINSPHAMVALFETEGDVSAEGPSPEEAVARLWLELKKRKRVQSSFS